MQHFAIVNASPVAVRFVNLHHEGWLSDSIRLRAPKVFEALPGGKLVTWHPQEVHNYSLSQLQYVVVIIKFSLQMQF